MTGAHPRQVLANGGSNEMRTAEEVEAFRAKTTAHGVLVARAAMWNPSIFRSLLWLAWS